MLNSFNLFFTNVFRKYLPDAYVFALLLTLIVVGAGVLFTPSTLAEMIHLWGDGLWNLHKFGMQMCLILITGFTLAKSKTVDRFLDFICTRTRDFRLASLITFLVSVTACYLNWGFGLIVSALIALKFAKKLKELNFPFLIAISYAGFLFWHGGPSGSIPLKLTKPKAEIQEILGVESISLTQTIYSELSLFVLFSLLISLSIFVFWLAGKVKLTPSEAESFLISDDNISSAGNSPHYLERSSVLSIVIGIMGIYYIGNKLSAGGGFGLDLMIFLFLILAIIFNKTPQIFLNNFTDSIKGSAGILLQFPFYAGIMSMMKGSGLGAELSEFFVSISTKDTFLLNTYLSAGLVNFFVPSGGGQWVIQGPIVLNAAKEIGVSLNHAAMAIAWGDAWSNMVQPFWALPLLGLAKISVRDIMGYLVMIFLGSGLVTSLIFLLY